MSDLLVTADANILASGTAEVTSHPSAAPARFVRSWRDRSFILVESLPLIVELERTLQKPYFAQRVRPEDRVELQRLLDDQTGIVPLTEAVSGVATHPEDDVVLATALSGGAQFVVTGDYKLLSVKQYRGLILLTAAEFLGMLPGLLRGSPLS